MTIILTNDDGIDAPGIAALHDALELCGLSNGVRVAPKGQLSGCSHQITRGYPIPIERRGERAIAIGGTPADCTRVAVSYLHPDTRLVVSGINAGGNLGADVYVSGTVAAVREAVLHRVPGIAISHYIKGRRPIDWAIATRLAARALDQVLSGALGDPHPPGIFWNINLPHLGPDDPEPSIQLCQLCTQPLPIDYVIDPAPDGEGAAVVDVTGSGTAEGSNAPVAASAPAATSPTEGEGEHLRFVGDYSLRPRDAQSDVEVCFSGQIAVTRLSLWPDAPSAAEA